MKILKRILAVTAVIFIIFLVSYIVSTAKQIESREAVNEVLQTT